MTKKLKFIALAIMLTMLIIVPGINPINAGQPTVAVKVNNETVNFPDQKAYIDNFNRTQVPMRAPLEKMGCKVDWDESQRQAIVEKDGTKVVFTIGSKTYSVNSKNKTMDTVAVITGSRTCIPIRFAAEAFGATVGWSPDTYTVDINTIGLPAGYEKPEWTVLRNGLGRTIYVETEPGVSRYFRFVCTSHPELNKINTYDWNGNPIVSETDVYTTTYRLAPGGKAYNIPLEKGMVITFDVYEKINGIEYKIDTIVETL